MSERIIFTEIDNRVHGVYELHNDFTFCTIAIADESVGAGELTNKKITCPDCIRVVKYFKSIKSTEYIKLTD